MLQRLRSRLHGEDGFTLIELLVVILIIGILAAIAIPSFLNQKGKGEDASAKSMVKTVQTALETYNTDNNTYVCGADNAACGAALNKIEPTIPAAMTDIAVSGTSTTGYTITVTSEPSKRTFSLADASGVVTRTCTVPTGQNAGGCKDSTSTTAGW